MFASPTPVPAAPTVPVPLRLNLHQRSSHRQGKLYRGDSGHTPRARAGKAKVDSSAKRSKPLQAPLPVVKHWHLIRAW